MSRVMTRCSLVAMVAVAACGGDDGAGPGDVDGATLDAPHDGVIAIDASPDAPAQSTRPFGGLRVWKDGCSKELWGRWRNDATFTLTAIEAREVGGNLVARTTFFEDLTFLAGKDDVWLLFDGQDVPDAAYQLIFELAAGPRTVVTMPIEPPFHEAAGRVTIAASHRDAGRVMVELTATFSGTLQRLRVYNLARCNLASTTYATEPALGAQRLTVPLGVNPPAGTPLLVVFEGTDNGLAYSFYATARLNTP